VLFLRCELPARKQISREKLLDAAYNIVREEGIGALNMRTLAKKCGCSTQPIYLSFSGADDLKKEVAKMIMNTFDAYIEKEIANGQYPEYKAVGMGYIRFAKEEKNFFKFLLMNEGKAKSGLENESFDKSVFMIVKNYGLYEDEARKLHAEMWIFVHGIATMYATEYLDWDWNTVSEFVSDVYKGLTAKLKGDSK